MSPPLACAVPSKAFAPKSSAHPPHREGRRFTHLGPQGRIEGTTMVATVEPKVSQVAEALRLAAEAALKADPGPECWGGTCHCDAVMMKLPRWTDEQVAALAELAGVPIGDKWGRGYWCGFRSVRVPALGQGTRSERMIDAAYRVLASAVLPAGVEVRHYQQAD